MKPGYYFFLGHLILLLLFLSIEGRSQDSVQLTKLKTTATIQNSYLRKIPDSKTFFTIYTDSPDSLRQLLKKLDLKVIYQYDLLPIIVAEGKWSQLNPLLKSSHVLTVDEQQIAKPELLLNSFDPSVNNLSIVHYKYPLINGNGITVSLKEDKPDTTDSDIKGRYIPSAFTSTNNSTHATTMSTLLAGGGNSWYNNKGAAWGAGITSQSFQNLLPEPQSFYQQYNITVQNHSYGTLNENFYGNEAAAYDALSSNTSNLLHIFSAGNSGTTTPSSGLYNGIGNWSNMTGNFKQSKNVITVGHLDSFYHVLPFSSRGPAYDGRVKPELVAFGLDGSSGAAAIVSGIAAMLQHAYKMLHNALPPASLVKAVLINGAKDVERPGIDFISGYGSADAYHSLQHILQNRCYTGTVPNNSTQSFSVTVPAGIRQLKVTLAWTDPSATPLSTKALLNNLDLEAHYPAQNQSWKPWVLNHAPSADSLQQLPQRKRDTLNTVEQITIDSPEAGQYIWEIKATNLATNSQDFSIAYSFDSVEIFNWEYPSGNDNLYPSESNVIRWKSTLSNSSGTLQISTNKGNSWQTISSQVNLSDGYFRYTAPDIHTQAMFRMQSGTTFYPSDTFTISKRIKPSVGFNCSDSFLLYWPPVTGVTSYRVFQLGNRYMEPAEIINDTMIVLSKANHPSLHYAVAPVIEQKEMVRSYAFNYTTQGTDCYIKSFLATTSGNLTASLELDLGSAYQVKAVRFEKKNAANQFILLERVTNNGTVNYKGNDPAIVAGTNTYRAVIELQNGKEIYSSEELIYDPGPNNIFFYPNPLAAGSTLTILSALTNEFTFEVVDTNGRVVYKKIITDQLEQITLRQLPKGIYFCRFTEKGKTVKTSKLVLY